MNNNRIINVGWPTVNSDATIKEYVDNKAEKTLREEGSGDAWDYSSGDEIVTTPLGEWDFCFLTGFDRDSKGGNKNKIRRSRCELTESSGEWTLTTEGDDKGHTRCGARCVKFGEAAPAVIAAPTAPTSFSADWACHRVCVPTPHGPECDNVCGVRLSWVDVDNETGYEIRRDGGFLSSPVQNATQADGGDVDPGTTYYYQIKACNSGGCSGWSSISITTD